jgi:hypothetical protein
MPDFKQKDRYEQYCNHIRKQDERLPVLKKAECHTCICDMRQVKDTWPNIYGAPKCNVFLDQHLRELIQAYDNYADQKDKYLIADRNIPAVFMGFFI